MMRITLTFLCLLGLSERGRTADPGEISWHATGKGGAVAAGRSSEVVVA